MALAALAFLAGALGVGFAVAGASFLGVFAGAFWEKPASGMAATLKARMAAVGSLNLVSQILQAFDRFMGKLIDQSGQITRDCGPFVPS